MKLIFRVAAAAALCLLAACAGQPEIPYDRSVSGVKTIGVVTPDMPVKPVVWLATDAGQSFGLVGALVDAQLTKNRSDKLEAMLTERNVQPFPVFNDALTKALQGRGYTVVAVPVQHIKSGFLKTYPGTSGVDAYLDVDFVGSGYGYLAAGMSDSEPYRPFVYLNVRLVSAKDNSVLMQDLVLYNVLNGQAVKAVTISPDPAYAFANVDAMSVTRFGGEGPDRCARAERRLRCRPCPLKSCV